MKVFELINALACCLGDEDVYLADESLELVVGGQAICELEEGAPEPVVKFSSDSATQAHQAAGLEDADYAGQKASGSKGFTVADVKAIAAAKAELEQIDGEAELDALEEQNQGEGDGEAAADVEAEAETESVEA